jgi:hypothetical protein
MYLYYVHYPCQEKIRVWLNECLHKWRRPVNKTLVLRVGIYAVSTVVTLSSYDKISYTTHIRFEGFTKVNIKVTIFWDMPHAVRCIEYHRLGRTRFLKFQETSFSETSVPMIALGSSRKKLSQNTRCFSWWFHSKYCKYKPIRRYFVLWLWLNKANVKNTFDWPVFVILLCWLSNHQMSYHTTRFKQ